MSNKKPAQISLPAIDGKMSDAKYYTKNSFINEVTLITKAQMKTEFKNRFGYFPEEIFFGKPNGSLIFAGPVLENSPPPATGSHDLQQEQLSLSFNKVQT